jgi:hypothetical protein
VSPPLICKGYTNSLHWAYPVIGLGVACLIAAGLSASKLFRRRGRTCGADSLNAPEGPLMGCDSPQYDEGLGNGSRHA